MIDEINDITLSQVCEALESENAVFEGLFDLSLSPHTADSMEIEKPSPDPDQSRFGPSVSDVEIKTLIKDQENVNTKNNTKWAMNLFEKWRAAGRKIFLS
jgi:hypothetical protein